MLLTKKEETPLKKNCELSLLPLRSKLKGISFSFYLSHLNLIQLLLLLLLLPSLSQILPLLLILLPALSPVLLPSLPSQSSFPLSSRSPLSSQSSSPPSSRSPLPNQSSSPPSSRSPLPNLSPPDLRCPAPPLQISSALPLHSTSPLSPLQLVTFSSLFPVGPLLAAPALILLRSPPLQVPVSSSLPFRSEIKISSTSSSTNTSTTRILYPSAERVVIPECQCRSPAFCTIRTSYTAKNPLRRYVTCSRGVCKFWEWYDREQSIWEKHVLNYLLEKLRRQDQQLQESSMRGEIDLHYQVLIAEKEHISKKYEESTTENLNMRLELERMKERVKCFKIVIIMLLFVVVVLLLK